MVEEGKEEQETKPNEMELRTPAPVEYTTNNGRTFVFGKPALKHRNTIMKVLKLMANQTADYDAIIKCSKERGISLEQFIKLDESELTDDEKKAIIRKSEMVDNLEFAEVMNDVLTEALYATIKKAPFLFENIKDFEEKMDDYAEAMELFPIAIKWIAQSAQELAKVNKKN